ncbi:MAG TPA: hypothetical protein VK922_00185 [Gemmatimonadaceae bacterium]|nr:hypothetical protein [Gemmatimonadaceae bacterium]
MRALISALLIALAIACGNSRPPAEPSDDEPHPKRVSTDVEFTLARGERASIGDGFVLITFLAVASDSRCPADVVCVWQGDAAMTFRIESPLSEAPFFGLDTLHTELQPRAVTRFGYRVQVKGLQPYPYSSDDPGARNYRVTLVVSRAE